MHATKPHNSDIDCCRQIGIEEILSAPDLCPSLVTESIRYYQSGQRYPLTMIGGFN